MEISVDAKSSFVGTVTYMSPERIQGGAHSFDSDLWSFGLTLAECALGCFPYDDSTAFQPRQSSRSSNQSLYDDTSDVSLPSTPNAERGSRKREHADISTTGTKKRGNSFWVIMDNIVSMAPPKIPEERFSSEFCSFVDACLQKEPSQRPTVATLLQHPFLTKYAAPTGTDPAAFAMSELCDWIRTIEQSRSNANSATNSTASSPMARVASIGSGVAASPRNPIGAVSSSVRSALATPSALADVAILVPTPRNNVVATGSSSTATPLSHSAANLSLASNSPEFETLATRSSTVSAAAPPRATKTFRFEAPSAVSSSALRVKSV
jgi:serine/threonine protein kinase